MNKARSLWVVMLCAALVAGALTVPNMTSRVQAVDDTTVSNITITQLDCAGWYTDGFITWDKDNTGNSRERFYVRVYDGDGTLVSEHMSSRPVGEAKKLIYPGTVTPPHSYELATPDHNPLTMKLYSPGGNGTTEEWFTLGTGSCSTLSTFNPTSMPPTPTATYTPTLAATQTPTSTPVSVITRVTAVDDSYSTPFETTLDISASGVMSNDTFPSLELSTMTIWSAQKVSDPSHGAVTLNADGSFVYVPSSGFSGTDSFTYKLRETAGPEGAPRESNTATVTITVGSVATPDPTYEPTPVPGCDAFIQIPDTAVGGMLARPALLQYEPGLNTDAGLSAGTTLLVLARDATGEYYQVLWQCQKLWLPLDAVGPNPQYPWNGAPLP